jgi:DNA-binding winged helix-turn-helix (wHTH) protein
MVHGDRSVDVFVRKLRQKLERASPSWRYIHTHFGIGYRFEPQLAEGAELPADGLDNEIHVAEKPEPQRIKSSA